MAITATTYGHLGVHLADGTAVLDDAHLKVLLVSSGYTFDQDADEYLTDVVGEVAGTNYVAGGVACSGVTRAYDAGTNLTTVDLTDDPMFENVTLAEVAGAIFYSDTGTAGTSPLVAYWENDAPDAPTAADYVLGIDDDGLLQIAV